VETKSIPKKKTTTVMNTKNEDKEPKKRTIQASAMKLEILNKENEKETPILTATLYVVFTDNDYICHNFIFSNKKHLAEGIASYTCTEFNPFTGELLCDYTLFRKDISPTHTSNFIKCPNCDETHFQWTDLKLETSTRFVDPFNLPLSDYDSLSVDVFISIIPEVDYFE
jgi:hypothetical protein